jgi:hypothetical protein
LGTRAGAWILTTRSRRISYRSYCFDEWHCGEQIMESNYGRNKGWQMRKSDLEISCSWETPPRCTIVTGELNPVWGLKLSNGFYQLTRLLLKFNCRYFIFCFDCICFPIVLMSCISLRGVLGVIEACSISSNPNCGSTPNSRLELLPLSNISPISFRSICLISKTKRLMFGQ